MNSQPTNNAESSATSSRDALLAMTRANMAQVTADVHSQLARLGSYTQRLSVDPDVLRIRSLDELRIYNQEETEGKQTE